MDLAHPEARLIKELEIIVDYHATGELGAGQQEQSQPVSQPSTPGGTNGSLGPGEHVELLAEEYWPPFSEYGEEEDLRARWLILDSRTSTESWFRESGRADLNATPPAEQNARGHQLVPIGGGLLAAAQIIAQGPRPGENDADVMGRALAALAVPRADSSVVVVHQAGATPVTGARHTRYWGHRWTDEEITALANQFPGGLRFGGRVRVKRPWANNGKGLVIEFEVPEVPLSPKTFTKLAGGPSEDTPLVLPFRRFAINAQPTPGNQREFAFSWNGSSSSNVGSAYEDLNFNYAVGTAQQGVQNNILIVSSFGVRPLVVSADTTLTDLTLSANYPPTAAQYFRIIGDQPSPYHPNNGLPCTVADNPALVGWVYPTAGGRTPRQYLPLSSPTGAGLVVGRAQGYLAVRDNGTSVPAWQIGALVWGLEFRNYSALAVIG